MKKMLTRYDMKRIWDAYNKLDHPTTEDLAKVHALEEEYDKNGLKEYCMECDVELDKDGCPYCGNFSLETSENKTIH